jgi:hypothetical protein
LPQDKKAPVLRSSFTDVVRELAVTQVVHTVRTVFKKRGCHFDLMPHFAVDNLDDRSFCKGLPTESGHLAWKLAFQVTMDDVGDVLMRH